MKPSLAFPIPHTPEFDVNRIKNISEKYLDISYASEKEHVLDLYLSLIHIFINTFQKIGFEICEDGNCN